MFNVASPPRWLGLSLIAVIFAGAGSLICDRFGAQKLLAAEPVSGQAIYETKCVRCHGPNGAGSAKYKQQLEGDYSVAQLSEVIRTTMPSDAPESLSPAESSAVAQYIHNEFYSTLARERNRPARIDLARLTTRQFRNAVADVIGSFRGNPNWGTVRGLKGEYYRSRHFDQKQRTLERVDPRVDFDFGTESPVPQITDPREFSLRWTGSLTAPETGEYTFVVRTEHATKLLVNHSQQPLIDAWVKSGSDTEYQGRIFLVEGRIYPLTLEFSKANQGVKDQKKEPPASKPASISLQWKRPQGVLEPIGSQHLSPNWAPEAFVCSTPFPPDDRSYGWERGTSISKAWDQATTEAAFETAAYVTSRLDELAGTRDDAKDRGEKHRKFCCNFIERAFRQPLTEEQSQTLIDKQFHQTSDPLVAVKRIVLLTIKSPRFLYREVDSHSASFETASRLSFGLWDSIPDQELLQAAARGALGKPDQIASQANRLVNDPRGKAKLRDFLLTWLKVDAGHDLSKNPERFPGFSAEVIADLRTSLELGLDDVLWSNESDYRQLLTGDTFFINQRLAQFYDAEYPPTAEFVKTRFESEHRAGVLTHPYLMAMFAHSGESSPIHRGVFLARGVLGQSLRPPPEAVAPLAADLHPNLTTRERVTLQTQATSCMTCHGIINPLGFTLEHFDAVGRYRSDERKKAIDASGSYFARSGQRMRVNGARQLAEFVASSEEAQHAFVEQMFHHLVQQPIRAYGPSTAEDLRKAFIADGFHMRKLAIRIMTLAATRGREHRVAISSASQPSP